MRSIIISVVAAALTTWAALDALAQQQVRERERVQQRTQERAGKREIIPGSELMTPREREDYRRRYAAAGTDAEREKVRADHIAAMQERARLRGLQIVLPEPARNSGK